MIDTGRDACDAALAAKARQQAWHSEGARLALAIDDPEPAARTKATREQTAGGRYAQCMVLCARTHARRTRRTRRQVEWAREPTTTKSCSSARAVGARCTVGLLCDERCSMGCVLIFLIAVCGFEQAAPRAGVDATHLASGDGNDALASLDSARPRSA